MPFDGGFLHKIIEELRSATECHIDKIYQPSRDELVLLLRKKGFAKRLYISVKSGAARIQFTETKFENPAVPFNFCMLLRKHLSSAKLTEIIQPELERVAILCFSTKNEMGDIENLRLICELIGNQSNIILVRENGKIIDALRRSDVETAKRLIVSGALYEPPATQGKLNPLKLDVDRFCRETEFDTADISRLLLNSIDGFSPLVCREIEYLSKYSGPKAALRTVIENLSQCKKAVIVYSPENSPFDYSYTNISQYGKGYKTEEFESFSLVLDKFYSDKENMLRVKTAAQDIIRLIGNLRSRTEKKLGLRLVELEKCRGREILRIYGELLKANLYRIENGSRFAEVENYYTESLETVKIPLNPALSPAKNAEKYFKDYKKSYSAEQALTKLTENDRNELMYFESVSDSISRCETVTEIAEIRTELVNAGYIKQDIDIKKKQNFKMEYREYVSDEGYRIIVGKNNTQNDYITTKLASKNDLWFHTKNIAGSHVVVFCGGQPLSDQTVLRAATLAAQNSKAAGSAQVPVDYTPVKYVKKPNGAKPGMVIYTTNKTVYVTPKKE